MPQPSAAHIRNTPLESTRQDTHTHTHTGKHFLQESNHTRGKTHKHAGDLVIRKEILFLLLDERKEALISWEGVKEEIVSGR